MEAREESGMTWIGGPYLHLTGAHGGATRAAAIGRRAAVSTSQAVASWGAARVLEDGGNAFDAAIAAAALLAVVEPYMSGVGGVGGAVCYDARSDRYSAL